MIEQIKGFPPELQAVAFELRDLESPDDGHVVPLKCPADERISSQGSQAGVMDDKEDRIGIDRSEFSSGNEAAT